MRRLVLAAVSLCLAAAGFLVARDAVAKPTPVVNSIVEGRAKDTNKEEIIVVGDNLTAVSQFNLADTSGTLAGQLTLLLKTKNLIVFGLPDGLAAAHYTLRLFYGKNAAFQIAFDIVVSNLVVPPASVTGAALDPSLRVDLDDATTLGGHLPAYFNDATNLTGTIDPARFSAYGDLGTELRIGTGSTQLAVGDHNHDARYLLRAGDTANSNFAFSANTGTALAGSTASSTAYGISGTNTAATGVGVFGQATSTAGNPAGVKGTTAAATGSGVEGDNTAVNGAGSGVLGTTTSSNGAGVSGTASSSGAAASAIGVDGTSAAGLGSGVRGTTTGTAGGSGVFGTATAASGGGIGVFGNAQSPGGTALYGTSQGFGMQLTCVGTGMIVSTSLAASATNAIAIFQQNGTNKARIDTNGKGYFNGGTAVTGADFAESVATALPAKQYEPGDVMVIDVKGTRRFELSSTANSKLVAGVYATKPGVLAGIGDVAGDAKQDAGIPLAIVGIVPCKVCDENGAIEAGDLLVSSSTPGHAMKAPENPVAGTVVGKALANFAKGSGKIEVLLIGR